MSTNFTPLLISTPNSKRLISANTILVSIALVITALLGALLWFLIAQKQQEERRTAVQTNDAPTTKEVVTENVDSAAPSATITATLSPTATPAATLIPQASPSAIINQ